MRHFRNLARADAVFGPRLNVLSGDNGAGKTNLLEAIHYVIRLETFRGARTSDLIEEGQESAILKAKVTARGLPRDCEITLRRDTGRAIELNGKRPRSLTAWKSIGAVVLFHPGDVLLASGDPERRRQYLDECLVQMDASYRGALQTYTRALRSRNRLLKKGLSDVRPVRAYNELLAASGAVLGQSRKNLVARLGTPVSDAAADILGEEVRVTLSYVSRVEPTLEKIREALADTEAKDRVVGYTTRGPHTDDVLVRFKNNAPVKHRSSQGQQRIMALAFRFAELRILGTAFGVTPILLLDDVSSELDRTRTERFFEVLAREAGQIFVTTTQPQLVTVDHDRDDFRLESGRLLRFP